MIDTALIYIKDLVNQHFKNEFSISENKVVLSNIMEAEGVLTKDVESKIVFFLITLDEESTLKNSINRGNGSSNFVQKNPPLHLNMQVFFCANFKGNNYSEGLRYLSSLIRFFQINNMLDPSESSDLPNGIAKLHFELLKLNHDQISNLWSAIGSKLLPSVLYRVGLLVFEDAPIKSIRPVIKESKGII